MVDKLSTSADKDKYDSHRRGSYCGTSIFKPTLGFGVRFSQSQENVLENMPSSRLRAHMSLPNLGKEDVFHQLKHGEHSKISEIDDEKCEEVGTPVIQISKSDFNDVILAASRKRPQFDDLGSIQPMDFLEDLKLNISDLNIPTEKQLAFTLSCLNGVPLLWARCFKHEFKNMQSFYQLFEQEFWGPDRQKAVLYDMKLGKFDETNPRLSMSEYFLHKVSSYRHLTPPPSDLEIVYSLAAHFPSAVELELRLSQKPSLREAYRVLRRRETEASDFLPNYLYEMCEAFQRGQRPESARTTKLDGSANNSARNNID